MGWTDTGRVSVRPGHDRRLDFHGRGPAVHGKSAPERGMRKAAAAGLWDVGRNLILSAGRTRRLVLPLPFRERGRMPKAVRSGSSIIQAVIDAIGASGLGGCRLATKTHGRHGAFNPRWYPAIWCSDPYGLSLKVSLD
jgi:hypothetical protein